MQGVRMMRLAAVTSELQCMGENDGLGRHKQVRWESGRWSVEEVYMGQGEGRDGNGGRQGGEHSVIVSWGSTDEVTIDSEEDELRRRGAWELEAAAVESTAARRGYTTGAAWDEGAMIQAMARMDNTLGFSARDGLAVGKCRARLSDHCLKRGAFALWNGSHVPSALSHHFLHRNQCRRMEGLTRCPCSQSPPTTPTQLGAGDH